MKAVIYRRVSTEEQGRSGLGLEGQSEYISQVVTSHDIEVIGEFVDTGISGAIHPIERDGLKAALELAKSEGACLLVAKLDRLSRDVEHVASLMKEATIKVATMMQADNFQLHLFAALAEQERKFIKERITTALTALKARAAGGDEVSQQKVQTWSDNIAIAHARGENRKVSLQVRKANADKFAASVEDNILAAMSKGNTTLQKIADYLNGKGITTRRGGEWTPIAVSRIKARMAA